MESKGEIILYQPDDEVKLDVRLENETVWLTQMQMAELFHRERTVITRHIGNIFKEKELDELCNVHFLHFANSDKPVKAYSLDVIISVGYRVKSIRGTQFRIWANRVLKEYLLKGDTYMKLHRHIWLPERYPVCRTDAGKVGRLNEKGVKRTCQILKEVIASILKQTRSQ